MKSQLFLFINKTYIKDLKKTINKTDKLMNTIPIALEQS